MSEGCPTPPTDGADLEDLLDPNVFHNLVLETYKKELSGNNLILNTNIPRIVKRYEDAFKALGIEFYKTRPARLFLNRIAENPNSVLPQTSQENFERLFEAINQRLLDQIQRRRGRFYRLNISMGYGSPNGNDDDAQPSPRPSPERSPSGSPGEGVR